MKPNVKFVRLWVAGAAALLGLTGCADAGSAVEPMPDEVLVEIVLHGNIAGGLATSGAVTPQSRAIVNAQHDELEVDFARLDMNTSTGQYPTDWTGVTSTLTAKLAKSEDGNATAVTFDPKAYYLAGSDTEKTKTKLIGWHPRVNNSEITLANGVVTFTIDGDRDIMVTDMGEGSKAQNFADFTFAHKLTQVQVYAYALNQAAQERWGKIKSLKLKDQEQKCILTLADSPAISWGNSTADLDLVEQKAADGAAITYPLELGLATLNPGDGAVTATNAVECGYAMIKPIASGTKLTLVVEMEDSRTEEVEIDWTGGYEASKVYTLTLRFTVAEIEFDAKISEWVEHEWSEDEGDGFNGEIEL